ncbi:MAG: TonB-dependent receptor, partial [Polaribacter sp.]
SNLQTGSTAELSNYHADQQINSFYATGQLAYKNMVFLDFTGRNDWASILPTANNSFFYPSVAASVLLSDVFKGLKENNVNFLKIRGGWSQVGGTGDLG